MTGPVFTEDWFGENSCRALAGLVGEVANIPGMIVEIGSWEGRSTIALANAAYPRDVVAVDTWQGSPGEISAELAASRDVLGRFMDNIKAATAGNVSVWSVDWRKFVSLVDEPIALAFIDATHSYDEVRDNIEAFIPLMAKGGIICGDDAHCPDVQRAVADVFEPRDITLRATMWIWHNRSEA